MDGYVLLQGGKLLGERGGTREWKSVKVQLRVPYASSFTVKDEAGLGELILEEVRKTPEGVELRGVIPCCVDIVTQNSGQTIFTADLPA